MTANSTGNCYLCGAALGKAAMKTHLIKAHGAAPANEGGQECYLLKIEGAYQKEYWLFADVPVDKSLSAVDTFLREIWLECCGHLSEFRYAPRGQTLGKARKLKSLAPGEKFFHLYDYGTTTFSQITVMGTSRRNPQRSPVRILARNAPPDLKCEDCGKAAEYTCQSFEETLTTSFYCADCAETFEEDECSMLPVTNSPRMGECGYGGELDEFAFDPTALEKS